MTGAEIAGLSERAARGAMRTAEANDHSAVRITRADVATAAGPVVDDRVDQWPLAFR